MLQQQVQQLLFQNEFYKRATRRTMNRYTSRMKDEVNAIFESELGTSIEPKTSTMN